MINELRLTNLMRKAIHEELSLAQIKPEPWLTEFIRIAIKDIVITILLATKDEK